MRKDSTITPQDGPWGQSNGGGGKTPPHNVQDLFKNRPTMPFSSGGKGLFATIFAIAIGAWLATGFYQVNPHEEGIVLRFGQWIKTTEPGWHYHLPYPIEEVIKPPVTLTNQINIGFGNQDESLMLTGDRNIVDISVIVQWHIKNAGDFLFNIRDTKRTIKAATESAIREIIGQTPIDLTFAEGRADIQHKAKQMVQQILDNYKAGVQITEINLKDVNPPQSVIESFREVDRAYADQERMFNEAESYRNDVVPKARGDASHIVQNGMAHKESVIATATGDTAHFKALAKEHTKDPKLMERRLYFETMEKVMKDANKVIMDAKVGQNMLPHMKLPAVTPSQQ